MDLRPIFIELFRLALGSLWLFAGCRKLRSFADTRASVVALLGTRPGALLNATARLLPVAEIALGTLMLFRYQVHLASIVSAVALVAFALLTAAAAVRGTLGSSGCGCLGTRQGAPTRSETPLAAARVVGRNLIFAAIAAIVATWTSGAPCCGRVASAGELPSKIESGFSPHGAGKRTPL